MHCNLPSAPALPLLLSTSQQLPVAQGLPCSRAPGVKGHTRPCPPSPPELCSCSKEPPVIQAPRSSSAPLPVLLFLLSCCLSFEPSGPMSFPLYGRTVFVAYPEALPSPPCLLPVDAHHGHSNSVMATDSPTSDWSGQGLVTKFWPVRS